MYPIIMFAPSDRMIDIVSRQLRFDPDTRLVDFLSGRVVDPASFDEDDLGSRYDYELRSDPADLAFLITVKQNIDVFYVPEPAVVRWQVNDPVAYVQFAMAREAGMTARKELERYFRRIEMGVPALVGAGEGVGQTDKDHSDRFQQLQRLLSEDPPGIPGIRVELDDATFGLPSRVRREPPRTAPPWAETTAEFELEDRFILLRNESEAVDTSSEPFASFQHILNATAPKPLNDRAAIWTSGTAEQGRALREALGNVLKEFGAAGIVPWSKEQSGSWWQRFKIMMHRGLQTKTFQDHMHEFDHRLQMELIDKPAAEINSSRSSSVAELLAAIADVDEVVMHVYQTVIVKYDGKTLVRTIDAQTARELERSDALLGDPREVMKLISGINKTLAVSPPPTRGVIEG